jgi:hypothetical protein
MEFNFFFINFTFKNLIMALPSVFDQQTSEALLARLEQINPQTQPKWGTMDAAKLLAHLNVTYDLAYERIPNNLNFLMKLMMKLFVKDKVTNEVPYKQNERTAPVFIIKGDKDFAKEKAILIQNIKETTKKGVTFFEGRENTSFGVLSASQWSNMFYKHLDHHFRQFGI